MNRDPRDKSYTDDNAFYSPAHKYMSKIFREGAPGTSAARLVF